MIIEIGIVAGEIWRFLDKHGEATFTQLVSGIEKPRDAVLMSLGWLAREGHVVMRSENNDYIIALR
ncbi:MAG: winged helix-turn-helix domain-containing protein [Candidatus Omnitrophica bacterium]|nr:winged helix-turn-helix domain-containing protein [Candidatus Omnitrophota bacterium]